MMERNPIDFTNVCGLCGGTENITALVQSDTKNMFKKLQWITRKENPMENINIEKSCPICLQKMEQLVNSVTEIWKIYIETQNMLKEKFESSISKQGNFLQFDEIHNETLRKEIQSSINIEGCTNLEWLVDSDSSDGKIKSLVQHNINNIENKQGRIVSITRTNNRGLTYTSDSLNYIVKKLDGILECTICQASFQHRYRAEHHVRSQHTKEKPFTCHICSKGFMAASNLNRHISCVHEDGKFICEKCGSRFKKRYILTAHEQAHKGPPKIACPFGKCTKKFYADFVLKMHINNSHSGLKYVCEHCGKAFRTKIRLTNHLQRHGNKILKCPHCPKMFFIKTDRLLHMKYHKAILPWRCGKCNMYFKTTRGLQNHLAVTHSEKVSKVDLYKRNTAKQKF